MADSVRIGSSALSAEIALLGAELQRLTDGEGREYLWDGDPAWWSGRAPILFPIVGTLRDDHFQHDGARYNLPRHGFARRRPFTIAERRPDAVVLRLESDNATHAVWPFDFMLDMCFAIDGTRITMTAEVTNRSDQPMPASFGFHPALRWPLPGGGAKADHGVTFDHPEPASIRRLDSDGLLDPQPRPTPVAGDRLALSDDLFADDALIFDKLTSRHLRYGGPAGCQIAVDFPDMPELGLWSKPGAGFLCIEPWHGYADPAGFDDDIAQKPGVATIAAHEQRHFSMAITLLPTP